MAFLLCFGGMFSFAQNEITLAKRKGDKTLKINTERIIGVETSDRGMAGTVTSKTDSSLTIQTFFKRDDRRIDTTITVPFDSIRSIIYCKAKNIATCTKRLSSKTAHRLINLSTGAIIGVSLAGPYIGESEGSKIVWVWGGILTAICYSTFMEYKVNPREFDLEKKWKIAKR